jgi:hypothetical protein
MEVGHWETSSMSDYLDAATFSAQLNTEFRIFQSSTPLVDVELVEVTERGAADGQQPPAASRQQRFSLVFRSPRETLLQQGMYQMQHNCLGAFDLFVVPVGQDQDGIYYEAVFNRLR